MEAYMELSKKTTILFPPDLHARLAALAAQRGVSLGDLVRAACEREYRLASQEQRLAAVRELESMSLPVGAPEEMAEESVPSPEDLMP
jgi:predicted DNA-binding protein